jgi:hypothetical protein
LNATGTGRLEKIVNRESYQLDYCVSKTKDAAGVMFTRGVIEMRSKFRARAIRYFTRTW